MAQFSQIGLTDIEQAAERLKPVLQKTELIASPIFSELAGTSVWIKPESLQITGTYKIRGAYNMISQLDEAQKQRGLITSSAGNHAQGVAYAAQQAGVPATIVMPTTAPFIKIQATESYGVSVFLHGTYYDEAATEAHRLEKERGYTFVHAFDDWNIIAGQGTVGLEILKELPDADVILAPIGGGGLISGVAIAAKAINPDIKIIGVEAEGADAMYRSVLNKKIVRLKGVNTIADGVAVATVGEKTFQVVSQLVDRVVRVSDADIMEAFLLILEKHKLVAEPAGAVALAALLNDKLELSGKVVSILTGGNIDVVTMSSLIERGLLKMGRVFEFSVDLPDRPGQLLAIAQLLSDQNANVIQIEHNQFESMERFTQVRLSIKVETNGQHHIVSLIKAIENAEYTVIKETNGV